MSKPSSVASYQSKVRRQQVKVAPRSVIANASVEPPRVAAKKTITLTQKVKYKSAQSVSRLLIPITEDGDEDTARYILMRFREVRRQDGSALINTESEADVLEIASLLNYYSNNEDPLSAALEELEELCTSIDYPHFPWDCEMYSDLHKNYLERSKMEFARPDLIRRPDGGKCKRCTNEKVLQLISIVRSIDEGLQDKMTCAGCGTDYRPN